MKAETARLERVIHQEKAALADNLAALEVRARELTDWRWQVRQRPFGAVGVALAGGVVLAVLADRRRRPGGRHLAEAGEDRVAGPSLLSHPIIDRLVAALALVAAEKAVEVLGEIIPGLTGAMEDEPLAP